jgi:hypothetical protein
MKNPKEKLESYRHLWADESGRYVLIQSDKDSQDLETCLVYDLETKTALLEEDDDVYREVKSRLAQKGVPMLSAIPQ